MDTISTATIIGIAVIFVLVVLNVLYAFKIRKLKRNTVKPEHKPNKVTEEIKPNKVTEEIKEEKHKRKQRKSLLSRLHKKPDSSSNIWK